MSAFRSNTATPLINYCQAGTAEEQHLHTIAAHTSKDPKWSLPQRGHLESTCAPEATLYAHQRDPGLSPWGKTSWMATATPAHRDML